MAINPMAVLLLLSITIHSASALTVKLYTGISDTMNYPEARAYCQDYTVYYDVEAHLATWDSTTEYDVISDVAGQLDSEPFIGLDDIASNHDWGFVDGNEDYWYLDLYIC